MKNAMIVLIGLLLNTPAFCQDNKIKSISCKNCDCFFLAENFVKMRKIDHAFFSQQVKPVLISKIFNEAYAKESGLNEKHGISNDPHLNNSCFMRLPAGTNNRVRITRSAVSYSKTDEWLELAGLASSILAPAFYPKYAWAGYHNSGAVIEADHRRHD